MRFKYARAIERCFRKFLHGNRVRVDYSCSGLGVRAKNISFMEDPTFKNSWNEIAEANASRWDGETPDLRWKSHLIVCAAQQGLTLDGDFVELGVNTGLLASMVMKTTDFNQSGKKFYLFDTFEGIPLECATETERAASEAKNDLMYSGDVYAAAKRAFEPYKSAVLVKGILPGSLDHVPLEKIAFLSVDLNVVTPEIESIKAIWDRITPGAMIVLDDYGAGGHEEQYDGWNSFAISKNKAIFTSPTGQGLLVK